MRKSSLYSDSMEQRHSGSVSLLVGSVQGVQKGRWHAVAQSGTRASIRPYTSDSAEESDLLLYPLHGYTTKLLPNTRMQIDRLQRARSLPF